MPLQAVVDDIEQVPEQFSRDEIYEKVGEGGYKLKVDKPEALHDISALKGALQKERDAAKKFKEELGVWQSLGMSVEDIKSMPEKVKELEFKASLGNEDAKKQIDAYMEDAQKQRESLRRELQNSYEQRLNEEKVKIQELSNSLRQIKLSNDIEHAAVGYGKYSQNRRHVIKPELVDMVKRHLLESKRIDYDEDGKINIYEKDGTPTSLSPSEFFEEYYFKEMPSVYADSQGTGGGSLNGGISDSNMIPRDNHAAISANIEDIASGKKRLK